MSHNLQTITVAGNLTADPELRSTGNGVSVANVTIAFTPRENIQGEWKDGEPLFYRSTAWREVAENLAKSAKKGTRVLAVLKGKSNVYETKEGSKVNGVEYDIVEIGVSLEFATAEVTRNAKREGGQSAPAQRRLRLLLRQLLLRLSLLPLRPLPLPRMTTTTSASLRV